MNETTQLDQVSYPVVGRCHDVHDDWQGGFLRGIVFMRNGEFCAGVEELWEPDSLTATNITFSEGPGFTTSAEALKVAANKARDASQASRLQYEPESGLSNELEICSIKETLWIAVDELDEIKGHVGFLSTEEDRDQYYAGIERSHRGGESEIGWYGPYQSAAEAEVVRDELMTEEQMPPEPESAPSAPGMR